MFSLLICGLLNCDRFIFIHPFVTSDYDMPVLVFLFFSFLPSEVIFRVILTHDNSFATHDVCICSFWLALECCNAFSDHLSTDSCP